MDAVWAAVAAVGAAQGFLLATLLFARRDRALGWLGAALVTVSFMLVEEAFDLSGGAAVAPWISGATAAFELLLGPPLLFFAQGLREPARVRQRRDWLHVLPFLLAQGALVTAAGGPVAEAVLLVKGPVLFIYLLLSWLALSGAGGQGIVRSARLGLGALAGLGFVTFALLHLGRAGVPLAVDSDRTAGLGLTVGLYGLALATSWPRRRAASAPEPRYATSPLTPSEKRRLREELELHLRRERPWLDCDLSLAKLSETSGIPRHHLSQVLGEEMGTTFYDLVARLRAEEARRLLLDPAFDRFSVLDVAFEAGFNSKASFHRAVSRFCGATPSALRKARRGRGLTQL